MTKQTPLEDPAVALAKRPPLPRDAEKGRNPVPPSFTIYRSRAATTTPLKIIGIRPQRTPDRRLEWLVPTEQVADFEAHVMFRQGRIENAGRG